MKNVLVVVAMIVMAVPAGAERQRVAAHPAPPACLPSAVLAPGAVGWLAGDETFLYYGDWNDDSIWRVPRRGGERSLVARMPGLVVTHLTVDAQNVYALMKPMPSATHPLFTLQAIPKQGGTPRSLAEGIVNPKAIGVDDAYVYWVSIGTFVHDPYINSDGSIERVPIAGGARRVVASGLSGPFDLALDGDDVYFTETGLGLGNPSSGIRRVPKSGGAVVKIVEDPDAMRLKVVGDVIYFSDETYARDRETFRVVSKRGGAVRVVATDSLAVNTNFEVRDGRLYYYTILTQGALVSVPLTGGAKIVHLEQPINSENFLIDDCALYLATAFDAMEVRRIAR